MAAMKNRISQLEEELQETEKEKRRVSEQSARLTAENQLLREQHSKQVRKKSRLPKCCPPPLSKIHQSFFPSCFSVSCNVLKSPMPASFLHGTSK